MGPGCATSSWGPDGYYDIWLRMSFTERARSQASFPFDRGRGRRSPGPVGKLVGPLPTDPPRLTVNSPPGRRSKPNGVLLQTVDHLGSDTLLPYSYPWAG